MKTYSTKRTENVMPTIQVKTVDMGKERAIALGQTDLRLGRVVENRILTKDGPVKRHIEFELPEGSTFSAGDYIAILPQNPIRDVKRVLARFSVSNEEEVILSSIGPTFLPVGKAIKLSELLSGYLELTQPATTKDLGVLLHAASIASTRAYLEQLKSSYNESRLSVLTILESQPDVDLPIGVFLGMLPPMRVRQYSISSSPLWNSRHVSLTFSVFERPSLSIYDSPPPLLGVGSNYLANLLPGDRVLMAVRHCKSNPSTYAFRLPEDASTPVVMFCAGSGIAPMRGFIQERAAQRASGCEVGKMILFFGCRAPELDFLYAETDIREWVRLGLLDVRSAFSRKPQESEGCVYVQHRVWHDRADVVAAYKNGASFFTCGSSAVAKGVKATLLEIIKEAENCDDTEAATRLKTIKYATEIFE